jgi:molecular chaperone IbpA
MRYFDFSPLSRSTIGFDRIFNLLDDASSLAQGDDGYPPYNISRTGENAYRIEIAVAGFAPEELSVTSEENVLVVTGRKTPDEKTQYLHHGIAGRAFERRFNLADYVQVTRADLVNGLLSIDLVRELPEAMKSRKIEIGAQAPKTIARTRRPDDG